MFSLGTPPTHGRNGRRPLWGCLWFKRWRDNVELAVSRRQRLVAYFFEGQVGHLGEKGEAEDHRNPQPGDMGNTTVTSLFNATVTSSMFGWKKIKHHFTSNHDLDDYLHESWGWCSTKTRKIMDGCSASWVRSSKKSTESDGGVSIFWSMSIASAICNRLGRLLPSNLSFSLGAGRSLPSISRWRQLISGGNRIWGEGLITWPELCKKETNLWDGKGLGASQKAELLGRKTHHGCKTDEMTKICKNQMSDDGRWTDTVPIGSMVLVYMLTWLGYIDGKCYTHTWILWGIIHHVLPPIEMAIFAWYGTHCPSPGECIGWCWISFVVAWKNHDSSVVIIRICRYLVDRYILCLLGPVKFPSHNEYMTIFRGTWRV